MEYLEVIALLALLVLVFLYRKSKPFLKGKTGEITVGLWLKRLNSSEYKSLNDILLTTQFRSSQIDHIVVSIYGIFVIETKHYKGWIFGSEKAEYWTQTLFHNKYKLRNPIIQCWGHIKTLRSVLKEYSDIPIHPIVVFSGKGEIREMESQVPVVYDSELVRTIKDLSEKEYLSISEVENIVTMFNNYNLDDRESRREHINKAKYNAALGRRSDQCPRCGGSLILKEGKYGDFLGCPNYPSCTFTKDYSI